MSRSLHDQIVDQLIDNAVDFIERAIDELETAPKYAAIHFHAGLEILLKTRLAMEHWTLMYEDPRKANLDGFKQGNFRSVGMGDAIVRLNNILPKPIAKDARREFDNLQGHRNQLVHFANPAYSASADKEQIAAEQCRAWYELRRLLTEDWKCEFEPFGEIIERLSRKMHDQRRFLEVKFERLKPSLDNAADRGKPAYSCPACDFPASRPREEVSELVIAQCLVCGHETQWLWFETDDGRRVRVGEYAEILDDEDDVEVSLEGLLSAYRVDQTPKEQATWPAHAYCDQCEHTDEPTVVPWMEEDVFPGQWLCLNCLYLHDTPSHCEWCSEYVTGQVGDYYNPGCVVCAHYIMSEAYRKF